MNDKDVNQNDSSICNVECKGRIVESSTLSEVAGKSHHQLGFVQLPKVIADFTAQIDLESRIELPEPVIEIKRIKRNVFLTECRLLAHCKKVFIKGFIRKNIEYATADCISSTAICGDIKHVTIHVPFHCAVEVKDMRHVDIDSNRDIEQTIFIDIENMGGDNKEMDTTDEEIFNEKIYCELVKAAVYEADIIEEYEKVPCFPKEYLFRSFIEKDVVCLTLKLLQKQKVGKVRHEKEC